MQRAEQMGSVLRLPVNSDQLSVRAGLCRGRPEPPSLQLLHGRTAGGQTPQGGKGPAKTNAALCSIQREHSNTRWYLFAPFWCLPRFGLD